MLTFRQWYSNGSDVDQLLSTALRHGAVADAPVV
jgi:hypothetical protein